MREIITYRDLTGQWRLEDLARAQFRLSSLLKQQSKPREATQHAEEAMGYMKQWEAVLPPEDYEGPERVMGEDEQQMLLFDLAVSIWHGRTTGKWSSGDDLW